MFRLLGIAASIFLLCVPAAAQTYPNRAVRIVVPLTPGGGNDTIARLIAQKLTVTLKQQVVVENRPGAGGLIGADYVAKAAPDGYTLLLGNVASLAIIPNLQKNVPYDSLKDFAPISLIASAPLLVVVHPSLPVKTIKQLIAFAKARPGQLNYASNGVGTTTHLATEMFASMTGIKMVHVPYKGLSAAMGDLMGGQVPLMFSSAVAMLPHVKTGRLRVLAMTGAKRSPAIPDVPTVAESGVPGYEAGSWYGILAPRGTPRPIVDLLSQQIAVAAKAPDMAQHLAADAVIAIGSTPDEFAAHIRKEFDRVHAVVNQPGAKFE
ncbi:MAG TPA: tripartite tricarboxylate transporter substrate binding protein [Burkholderiales bacterium]|nr:tripartite tricarboxylate transporter substrate binding protein [Burkholderiales bacterium]